MSARDADPQQLGPEPHPEVPEPDRLVHLPGLISDEFGVSRSIAREQIALGMVKIGDEYWRGDRLDIPYSELVGRSIVVVGRDQSYRIPHYSG